jgi:DNA adenine methylase
MPSAWRKSFRFQNTTHFKEYFNMRYFGGKGTIADEICMLINQWMDRGQEFLEPFVGSAWIVRGIKSKRRHASDTNPYLIEMYRALQKGWVPPTHFTPDQYEKLKEDKDSDPPLAGFIGTFCSFGGMWFAGLAKDAKKANYVKAAAKGCIKLVPEIRDVDFQCQSYDDWSPDGSFIYCDPPYADTGQSYFSTKFDSEAFWAKMREWSKNNIVIISEYKAPEDFKVVAQYRVRMKLNRDFRNEKVFSLNERYDPFEGIF